MINEELDHINRFWDLQEVSVLPKNKQESIFDSINKYLSFLNSENRIIWAKKYLPKNLILSSSFGVHSSVSLHLMTCFCPKIPIVLIDTGYLFPETYRFINLLTKKMKLNLHVFRSDKSSSWQEALYGKLWEQGIQGLKKYNFLNKVQPMQRALKQLKVDVWCAGLRRTQSYSRRNLPILSIQNGIFKFLPIIDWDDNQVHQYIKKYNLDYHPLWNQGYVSIGDIHTTSIKTSTDMKDEDTRFFGLQRECGLHILN